MDWHAVPNIFWHELRRRGRRRGWWVFTGACLAAAIGVNILLAHLISLLENARGSVGGLVVSLSITGAILAVIALLVPLSAAGVAAASIAEERERGSLDDLRMAGTDPGALVWGKYGAMLVQLAGLAACILPSAFIQFVPLASDYFRYLLVQILWFLVMVGCYTALGIAVSAWSRTVRTAYVWTYGIIGAALVTGWAVTGVLRNMTSVLGQGATASINNLVSTITGAMRDPLALGTLLQHYWKPPNPEGGVFNFTDFFDYRYHTFVDAACCGIYLLFTLALLRLAVAGVQLSGPSGRGIPVRAVYARFRRWLWRWTRVRLRA